ncbi:ATP-binding cassette subfamily B protein/ATP-binding cassette subfamily C protein/ATP-binding cassette subfamily B multidrug efflux pump [Chitinivorax tropicus]|uniref:ATP-binding cassette subfamily B protein/ATP-binding cassette subfamily C protein/ATP-binding cassette subfamily B multidrug efflux pump n=1 Tax=Chitinivorax tropicus TaxID=714531 RepID=A0A840MN24_9PROT|nr:ABC transporter transmembrane domain-containing protein [Chitinivorax tropicus]MBB5017906.1 ATP-binding cassette subfamily B protein/ATP-binding cassette subfamily C protein/ATP-binding cassette subfamily B multidrug efflux pump [Chitinivorax tropicus]
MTFSRLLQQFIRQHWRAYLASALMLTGIATLTVWLPRQVGYVIDEMVAGRLVGTALHQQLAMLIGLGVIVYFLRVGWRLTLFKASYRLGVSLREQLYRRLTLQGPAFFHQQRTGDLMACATNDIDAVEMAAGEAFLAGFDGSLSFVLVIAMMMLGVDWRLTLIALLPFPFMGMAFWYISNQVHHASRTALDRFSTLNDHVHETLSGVRTLRALGLQQRSAMQFAHMAESAAEASLVAQKWEAAYEPAVGITLTIASVLALALGGYLVWQQQMTIGLLTSFTMYLGQLIWPMFAAGWVLSLIERGRAAWGRLVPVLNAPLTIDDSGTRADLTVGRVMFDDVSFTYPGQSQPALQHIQLALDAGKTIGVVGPTGAGKSTLIRLLLRQYPVEQGQLTSDGTPLTAFQLSRLRERVSWVAQEPFLFSASIADNIALAKSGATREEVIHVARLASIHDDITRFPEGYDTPVGERGVTLSGGQRQRVAIARALLADSPVLLLDDALSAVDTETETNILHHLRDTRRGRTVLIVSHRLSAVADADHIVVMKHGRIVESGSHDALLAMNGWYATQWRYQQLEASLETI